MCHSSLQIGIQHWHSILSLRGNEDNIKNPYCRAELAFIIIRRKPIVEYFLKSLQIIFSDELDQLSAK